MAEAISILRKPEVLRRCGFSKSTLYTLIQHGEFSPPVRISARCVGWPSCEVDAWLERRIANHRAADIGYLRSVQP